jgi:hypothetical protein
MSGYLTVMRIGGDPDELAARYGESSEAMAAVGRDHDLILHAATRTEDGLMVVNLWPSKEESEAASRDQRRMAEVASMISTTAGSAATTTRSRTGRWARPLSDRCESRSARGARPGLG